MPTAPRRCRAVYLRKFHYPLPSGTMAIRSRRTSTRCSEGLRQHEVANPLPNALGQGNSETKKDAARCHKAVKQCARL